MVCLFVCFGGNVRDKCFRIFPFDPLVPPVVKGDEREGRPVPDVEEDGVPTPPPGVPDEATGKRI